jgi:hypothetical protein
MSTAQRYWGTVVVVNAVGAGLVFIGAETSAMIQFLGFAVLLPGSLGAAVLPLQGLWSLGLWRCCQTDAAGLSNVLYLPVAITINLLAWWAFRLYRLRRNRPRL